MRINIYEEEMGEGCQIIPATSRNGEAFIGLRIWLHSPQELLDHSTPEDDDRNAVTFYFRGEQRLIDFVEQLNQVLE
jgi:hypothetical protein